MAVTGVSSYQWSRVRGIDRNYQGMLGLQALLDKAAKEPVWVGFDGGLKTLKKSEWEALNRRHYKWDDSPMGVGKKDPRNWIEGKTFLEVVESARPGGVREQSFEEVLALVRSRFDADSHPWLVRELTKSLDIHGLEDD